MVMYGGAGHIPTAINIPTVLQKMVTSWLSRRCGNYTPSTRMLVSSFTAAAAFLLWQTRARYLSLRVGVLLTVDADQLFSRLNTA